MNETPTKKRGKLKTALLLFLTMFKIGLFTFGGGYAMIAILENEFVTKKGWIEHDEFVNLIAIAESTPGPIAINSATYIGYKNAGVLGSALATLGVVLPSFIIIFAISLFFDAFLALKVVAAAFRGIQVAVVFLILSAGIKMFKKMKKTPFNLIVMSVTLVALILIDLFALNFSTVFFILIGAVLGILVLLLGNIKKDKQEEGEA